MREKVNKILKFLASASACIVVVLAILLIGVRLFGLQIFSVLSPSMAPDYPTGSLVYVKAIDPENLRVNDVITFEISGSKTATHRIIEIVTDEKTPEIKYFRTKGDNNESADSAFVKYEDVIGKVVFCIPMLGFLTVYMQQPPGNYVVLLIGAGILLLMFISECITDKKEKKLLDSI